MSLVREVIVAGPPPAPGLAPSPAGSPVVRGGAFLFLSALTAGSASGRPLAESAAAQTGAILDELAALLAAAGSSLERVVKVTVLLADMREAPNMNEVYARYFGEPPPARTVCGARLPAGVRVMIECTALA